jgi:hypothetical protein
MSTPAGPERSDTPPKLPRRLWDVITSRLAFHSFTFPRARYLALIAIMLCLLIGSLVVLTRVPASPSRQSAGSPFTTQPHGAGPTGTSGEGGTSTSTPSSNGNDATPGNLATHIPEQNATPTPDLLATLGPTPTLAPGPTGHIPTATPRAPGGVSQRPTPAPTPPHR